MNREGQFLKLEQREAYAVELIDVSTYYYGEKRPAITDINLKIPVNTLSLVVGPNGAGKTTLLETILGLLKPRRGRVKVFGYDMAKRAQLVRKMCSYLPQDFMKDSDEPFLVKDVVAMGIASNRDLGRLEEEDWRRVYEALELVGMLEFSERPIGKLSGGQQQRVMLARALARRPRLLLLDEPFSSLDRESRRSISENLLPDLVENGCTVIMVSHDLTFRPAICDLVVRMESGKIVEVAEA